MKATYTCDTTQEFGYGTLRVNADILPPGNLCSFIIQRSSDGKCLSSSGWHDSLERLTPESTWTEKKDLVISLSPTLIAYLNELEMYRLILYAEGYPIQRCLFEVPGFLYCPLTSSSETEDIGKEPSSAEKNFPPEKVSPEAPTMASFPPEEKRMPLALIFGILFFLILLFGVWYSIHTAAGELQTTSLSKFLVHNEKKQGAVQS